MSSLRDTVSPCHIQYKPSSHYKGPLEFEKVRIKQDLGGTHLVRVALLTIVNPVCHHLSLFLLIPGSSVGNGVLYLWSTSGECVYVCACISECVHASVNACIH